MMGLKVLSTSERRRLAKTAPERSKILSRFRVVTEEKKKKKRKTQSSDGDFGAGGNNDEDNDDDEELDSDGV